MKVYTSPDLPLVANMKNILESYGIDCVIQQQFSSGAAGDIPINECWPQLWITNPMELDRAKAIVNETMNPPTNNETKWACPLCDELLEAQFTACWKCGTERDPHFLP